MCTVNAKGGKKYDVDKSEEDEVTARREDENQKCSCMLIYKYTMTLWNQKWALIQNIQIIFATLK